MKTAYDCYLLACREARIKPVSFWQFSVAYGKYQREFYPLADRCMDDDQTKRRRRVVAGWLRLVRLADMVERGRELQELARRDNGGDEPGTAGAGDREPRVPLSPLLVGCAARPLPSDDGLKDLYAWRV